MSDYFNLNDGVEEAKSKFPKFGKFNFKFNRKLLVVFIIVLALPITVLLAQQEQDTRQFASEKDKVKQEEKPLPPKGYIVEFKNAPVSRAISGSIGAANKENVRNSFNAAKANLLKEHESAKADILSRVNKSKFDSIKLEKDDKKVVLLSEFTDSFNGIAVDADENQINEIKKSPFVKAVYPNNSVKTNLMDSVPLIGADKVWQNTKDANENPVTGKGVNIAVIDTGVDYTHPDLGGTNLQERSFTKINNTAVDPIFSLIEEQLFSYDGDRVAYPSGSDKVSIYSFSTGQTETVNVGTNLPGAGIVTLLLRDQNLFITVLYNGPGSSIYYKNIATGEFKKVSDLTSADGYLLTARMNYYNGKLFYEKNPGTLSDKGYALTSIYSYDIATSTESILIDAQSADPVWLDVSGDKLIYRKYLGGFNNPYRIVLYNLSTGSSEELPITDSRVVQDFKGDYILYNEYTLNDKYHYYNILTAEDKIIEYSNPAQSAQVSSNEVTMEAGWRLNHSNIGSIGDGVIFFQRTRQTEQMVVYDLSLNRYAPINIKLPIKTIQVRGRKICFSTLTPFDAFGTTNIYCHDYDSSYAYPLPTNIFNSKVVGGYNFISDDDNPLDDNMHGTHVSEIIAGNGALKGVAPNANIIAYKVLGSGGSGTFSDVISALDKAILTRIDSDPNNDIDVINMSLGADCVTPYTTDCGPEDPASVAVNNAVDVGIVVVIAAGNSGPGANTIGSPGVAEKAITTGAVDKQKIIANFSSRGPVIWNGQDLHKPDISAPGSLICSATLYGFGFNPSSSCFPGNFILLSGTSMATPHVAGLAALILQAHPDWIPQQVKDVIKNNADDLGYDYNTQGAGMIDAVKIFGITQTPTPTLSPSPSPSPTLTLTPIPTPKPLKVTLNAVADAFVRSTSPNSNFGLSKSLETDKNPNEITYLRFNLGTLAGKTIISAKLGLKVSDSTSQNLSLRRGANVNWQETGITYNNKPTLESQIRTFKASTLNNSLDLDVKNAVSLRKGGRVTFGITSLGDDTGAFYSREAASANRPQLIVEYK